MSMIDAYNRDEREGMTEEELLEDNRALNAQILANADRVAPPTGGPRSTLISAPSPASRVRVSDTPEEHAARPAREPSRTPAKHTREVVTDLPSGGRGLTYVDFDDEEVADKHERDMNADSEFLQLQRERRYKNPTLFMKDWKEIVARVERLNASGADLTALDEAMREMKILRAEGDINGHFQALQLTAAKAAKNPQLLDEQGYMTLGRTLALMPDSVNERLGATSNLHRDVSNPDSPAYGRAQFGVSDHVAEAMAQFSRGNATPEQRQLVEEYDPLIRAGMRGDALTQAHAATSHVADKAVEAVQAALPAKQESDFMDVGAERVPQAAWGDNILPVVRQATFEAAGMGRSFPIEAAAAIVKYYADDNPDGGFFDASTAIRSLVSEDAGVNSEYLNRVLSGGITGGIRNPTELIKRAHGAALLLQNTENSLRQDPNTPREVFAHAEVLARAEAGLAPTDTPEYDQAYEFVRGATQDLANGREDFTLNYGQGTRDQRQQAMVDSLVSENKIPEGQRAIAQSHIDAFSKGTEATAAAARVYARPGEIRPLRQGDARMPASNASDAVKALKTGQDESEQLAPVLDGDYAEAAAARVRANTQGDTEYDKDREAKAALSRFRRRAIHDYTRRRSADFRLLIGDRARQRAVDRTWDSDDVLGIPFSAFMTPQEVRDMYAPSTFVTSREAFVLEKLDRALAYGIVDLKDGGDPALTPNARTWQQIQEGSTKEVEVRLGLQGIVRKIPVDYTNPESVALVHRILEYGGDALLANDAAVDAFIESSRADVKKDAELHKSYVEAAAYMRENNITRSDLTEVATQAGGTRPETMEAMIANVAPGRFEQLTQIRNQQNKAQEQQAQDQREMYMFQAKEQIKVQGKLELQQALNLIDKGGDRGFENFMKVWGNVIKADAPQGMTAQQTVDTARRILASFSQ